MFKGCSQREKEGESQIETTLKRSQSATTQTSPSKKQRGHDNQVVEHFRKTNQNKNSLVLCVRRLR